jgi:hypothetical protein
MVTKKNVITVRAWMNSVGVMTYSQLAEVFNGDVVLPRATIEQIEKMANLFCWLPILQSNPMWKKQWEHVKSMQNMLLDIAIDIWMLVRDGYTLWNMDTISNIKLKKYMHLHDDTVSGRRAAELYFRAGFMVIYTFHPDFISNERFNCSHLLQGLVQTWGIDPVATAKIKSSCINWKVVHKE